MFLSLLLVLVLALVASLALTPMVRALALRCQLVDRPSKDLKLHQRAVPLGGGLAVFAAALLAVLVAALLPGSTLAELQAVGGDLVGLAFASVIIVLVGLADDRFTLRGRQKLAGQLVAITVLINMGLSIRGIEILGLNADLGLLAIPFTVFWLLGAINAVNLLDGADGFATTVGIVISAALATLAALQGHPGIALVAIALTGALVGFLVYNFPPAKIFLGDTGSMLIGLVVGVLAIRGALKGPATVALAAPLAVLTIPILDSVIAVLRRWLTGRSLYVPDRGHLHHNLQRRGLGPRGLLIGISLLCAITAGGALVSIALKNELCAVASAGTVVAALVLSRVFGFSELTMVTQRAFGFGSSLLTSTCGSSEMIRQETVCLQGSRNWEELWTTLTDFAERHGLSRLRLDLNVPWMHEGFYARWQRGEDSQEAHLWLTRLPLLSGGRVMGRLELAGRANRETAARLELLSQLLVELQPCVDRLAGEVPSDERGAQLQTWQQRNPREDSHVDALDYPPVSAEPPASVEP